MILIDCELKMSLFLGYLFLTDYAISFIGTCINNLGLSYFQFLQYNSLFHFVYLRLGVQMVNNKNVLVEISFFKISLEFLAQLYSSPCWYQS